MNQQIIDWNELPRNRRYTTRIAPNMLMSEGMIIQRKVEQKIAILYNREYVLDYLRWHLTNFLYASNQNKEELVHIIKMILLLL